MRAPEKKELFVLRNEQGLYLKIGKPYWTKDINQADQRTKAGILRKAEELQKEREKYDNGTSKCYNPDLYLGYRYLFLTAITITEASKTEIR